MSGHFVLVEDEEDIRQGDVIRRLQRENDRLESWGFIITADCDIAQRKIGDRFTCLEIVRSEEYLEHHWAPEQFRRFADKQTKFACESLNGRIKRSNSMLSALDGASLRTWLAEMSAESIVSAVGGPADAKLLTLLRALRFAFGYERIGTRLEDLRQAWSLAGRDAKTQRSSIKEAFDPDRGFPDFVLVPELPATDGYGFVILLRAISTLQASALFRSETEARINGKPEAFHRIGRFSDDLRFSVAQKLAFLFSRIGMSTQYEDACEAATDLLVQTVYKDTGDRK